MSSREVRQGSMFFTKECKVCGTRLPRSEFVGRRCRPCVNDARTRSRHEATRSSAFCKACNGPFEPTFRSGPRSQFCEPCRTDPDRLVECSACSAKKPQSEFRPGQRRCPPCLSEAKARSYRRVKDGESLTCTACLETFPRRPGSGPQRSVCKPCLTDMDRITECIECRKSKPRSEFRREKPRERNVCSACLTILSRPERRLRRLKKEFGLTYGEKLAMFEAQEGRCAICFDRLPAMGENGAREPGVDHSYTTGKVRSLLCSGCNTSDGLTGRSPQTSLSLTLYQLNDGPYYGPITVISDLGTWVSTFKRVDGEIGRTWRRLPRPVPPPVTGGQS